MTLTLDLEIDSHISFPMIYYVCASVLACTQAETWNSKYVSFSNAALLKPPVYYTAEYLYHISSETF